MLQAEIIGRIGNDAVIKDFNGRKFIAFNVAHTERYRNAQGERTERTTWVSVLKYADENSNLLQYLTRGTLVYLRGDISARAYNGKNGLEAGLNLTARTIELLGGGSRDEAKQTAQEGTEATSQPAQEASQPASLFSEQKQYPTGDPRNDYHPQDLPF